MYLPDAFRMTAEETEAALAQGGLFTLVTAGENGPEASLLPLVWDPEARALLGHFARANDHWKRAAGPGLALLRGEDFYVTPAWYASKAETGKVVPTWNYEMIEARGAVETFDAPEDLRAMLDRLTALHEGRRAEPWAVSDAPERYVAAQMRGIVGMRLRVETLQGKRKMSQNKTPADREGVAAGLAAEGREALSATVRRG